MKKNCTILHLEDDDNDSLFFERLLTQLKFPGTYRRVASVQEAIEYFQGVDSFGDRVAHPLPQVLVADGTLGAGKTTANLMEWLAEEKKFTDLTRIVLSGTLSNQEQEKWFNYGITCVLDKGATLEDLMHSVQVVVQHCKLDLQNAQPASF